MIINERLLKFPPPEERITLKKCIGTLLVNENIFNRINGITYKNDFLTKDEEMAILSGIIDKNSFSTHLKRRQQFYGNVYYHTKSDNIHLQPNTTSGSTTTDTAIAIDTATNAVSHSITPFQAIIERCVKAGFFTSDPSMHPDQVLVNEYTHSTGIRSHFEDENAFGAVIVTISLGDPIWITLKKPLHHRNSCPSIVEYTKILLKPRSVFVMAHDARYEYRHGISKAKTITTSIDPPITLKRDASYRRISLTIRKLGDGRKRVGLSASANDRGWLDSDPLQGEKCECE